MHGMHEDADACMKHGMHDDACGMHENASDGHESQSASQDAPRAGYLGITSLHRDNNKTPNDISVTRGDRDINNIINNNNNNNNNNYNNYNYDYNCDICDTGDKGDKGNKGVKGEKGDKGEEGEEGTGNIGSGGGSCSSTLSSSTNGFSGIGSAFSDEELDVMQKHRKEDIPAIERLMCECGYVFSPTDESIVLELLNGGETSESIMKAVMIAKESNKLNWRYIKGILRNQKIGGSRYDVGGNQGKAWGSYSPGGNGGGSGYAYTSGQDRNLSGSGAGYTAAKPRARFQEGFLRYLESTFV